MQITRRKQITLPPHETKLFVNYRGEENDLPPQPHTFSSAQAKHEMKLATRILSLRKSYPLGTQTS